MWSQISTHLKTPMGLDAFAEWKTELRRAACLFRLETWSTVRLVGIFTMNVSLRSLCQLLLFKESATVMDSQKDGQHLIHSSFRQLFKEPTPTVLFFSAAVNHISLLVNMASQILLPISSTLIFIMLSLYKISPFLVVTGVLNLSQKHNWWSSWEGQSKNRTVTIVAPTDQLQVHPSSACLVR